MHHLTYDHEGKRTPGTWRPARAGSDDTIPLVMCPGCGERLSLDRQRKHNLLNEHTRNPTVSFGCPKCGFLGQAILHCWPLAGFPIKSHF